MDKCKPCPCCGNDKIIIYNTGFLNIPSYQARCGDITREVGCGLKIEAPTMEEAIERWNKRVLS